MSMSGTSMRWGNACTLPDMKALSSPAGLAAIETESALWLGVQFVLWTRGTDRRLRFVLALIIVAVVVGFVAVESPLWVVLIVLLTGSAVLSLVRAQALPNAARLVAFARRRR